MGARKSHEEIWKERRGLFNMAPSKREDWLGTVQSGTVGADAGDGGSKGHKSGRRIGTIKRKNKVDLTDGEYDHVAKVVGYIKRHAAQGGPDQDKRDSRWRYSLMNWEHGPLKPDAQLIPEAPVLGASACWP